MKIEYSKIDDVNGVITMVVEENDYAENVKKQLKELGKKHSEPGFRPGHVPAGLLEKKYGKYARQEAINETVGEALYNYIKEEKLPVLGNPMPDKENHVGEEKEFVLKFNVGLAPEFDVKVDKDVKIPYYNIKVSDEMIDRQDEALRRRFGKQVPGEEVDATALVKGVMTELNEDGTVKEGGIVVENGIVSPQYFKTEEQRALFMGKKLGDEVVFNPAATCDANPTEMSSMLNIDKNDVDAHKGDFRFDIKEIIVLKPAELGEEYFKEVFGADKVKDEKEYRDAVKDMIQASLKGDQNYRFTIDAKNVIMAEVGDLQLPDAMLKDFLISQNENLNAENIDAEYDAIRADLLWDLEKDKVGQKLGVKVEQEDLMNTARLLARQQFAQYGMASVPDDAIDRYANEILKDEKAAQQVARQTADMKLFAAIRDAVTLDEKEVSVDEFNALFAPAAEK